MSSTAGEGNSTRVGADSCGIIGHRDSSTLAGGSLGDIGLVNRETIALTCQVNSAIQVSTGNRESLRHRSAHGSTHVQRGGIDCDLGRRGCGTRYGHGLALGGTARYGNGTILGT